MKKLNENGTIQELESPFLHLTSFKQNDIKGESQMINKDAIPSPFKSVYELEGEEQGYDEKNEAFVELMDNLYDEEFEELVQEMVMEAQELYESQTSQHYELQNHETNVRQSLDEHFVPFLNEIERFMDYMAETAEKNDVQNMTDEEWETLADQYVPILEETPAFEDFGGWLKKKWKKAKKKLKKIARVAKKVVKKGVSLAKKAGMGFLIKRAKGYIVRGFRKVLKQVLKYGLRYVPKKYHSITKSLAKKIGVLGETSENEDYEIDFQQELDSMLAEFMLVTNETELGHIEQEFLYETDTPVENTLDQLDIARETFINRLGELQDNEDPQPAIEEFATAILMGLKWAIRIIGKKRSMDFAANVIKKVIQPYVGQSKAKMLSKFMVKAGFKLLNLELTPEQEVEEGNRALAAVVEDTVRQIASFPEHIIQNENLLESNIVQAFEESAKANLPDILTEETYIKRPDLREASRHKVAWKMKKIGKGKRKRCRYKKLNKQIETELTPYLAKEIKTYGGVSLGETLRDQMGVFVNKSIPVKVHLFETLPGSNRFYIGKNETVIPKLNIGNGIAGQQIHPLTSVAAGLLMGEPALGCRSNTQCLTSKNSSSAHRYYYLEIPGARPQMYLAPSGIQYLRKTTGLKVKLDFIKNQIHLFLFFSESEVQGIATQIRQHIEGNATRLISKALELGIKTAFSRHSTDNIRIIHPNVVPGKNSGIAMKYVPIILQEKLQNKLKNWTESKLTDYLINYKNEFIQAVDAEADGVTICITTSAPSGFNVLRKLMNTDKVQISENIFSEPSLDIDIKIKPGYQYV
ncbi:hypothetical protein [Aquimarina sp. AU474]|uniref:hypothetical protein n=1 Tax=Aquimarina sp. AU474 TaxID=2108529 RepID=UPI000D6936F4|nr:hypothetical protein [Aquimarina sp. AU474]